MKYAHLADLHIGCWREPKLRDLNFEAFSKSMDICIAENINFILFAGDLFNTALPAVDKLNLVAKKLKELKDNGIPMYIIPGSHDFSPSGKTMIDVLESAGLFTNVCKGQIFGNKLRLKFTVDIKTGAKITGMLGKKGMLDHIFYEDLDRDYLEKEVGYKIFMFHTTLSELKPKKLEKVDSYPLSLLPKGFDYYAGGHVHHNMETNADGYKKVTQPGSLFPTDFGEMEEFGHGGFFIIECDKIEWKPVKLKERVSINVNCDGKRPEEINKLLEAADVEDKIVTIRLDGKLCGGRVSDIKFKEIFDRLYNEGAFIILRNTAGLQSEEYEEIKLDDKSIEEIEDQLIKEHIQQVKIMDAEREIEMTKKLIEALSTERKEGEAVRDYEERVKEVIKIFD